LERPSWSDAAHPSRQNRSGPGKPTRRSNEWVSNPAAVTAEGKTPSPPRSRTRPLLISETAKVTSTLNGPPGCTTERLVALSGCRGRREKLRQSKNAPPWQGSLTRQEK